MIRQVLFLKNLLSFDWKKLQIKGWIESPSSNISIQKKYSLKRFEYEIRFKIT